MVIPRNLLIGTNCNWIISSHTLLPKHRHCIHNIKTHLSRRKLRIATTNTPCKRSLIIFRLHLFTHRAKLILRIIQLRTHIVSRGSNLILNHSNSIHSICITVRTNIILRCNCNYKPSSTFLYVGKGVVQ